MSIGEFQQGSWPNVGADEFTRVRGDFVKALVAERDAAIARAKEWEEKYKGAEQAGILMAGALTAVQDKIDELEKRLAEICGQKPIAWAFLENGRLQETYFSEKDWLLDKEEFEGEFISLIPCPDLPEEGT